LELHAHSAFEHHVPHIAIMCSPRAKLPRSNARCFVSHSGFSSSCPAFFWCWALPHRESSGSRCIRDVPINLHLRGWRVSLAQALFRQ
jgi:hypothetical protein